MRSGLQSWPPDQKVALKFPVIVLLPVAPDPPSASRVPTNEPATPVAEADVNVTVAVPRARFAVHPPVAAVHDRVVTRIWTLVPLPLPETVVTPKTIGPPTRTEVPVRVSIAWTTKIPGCPP